MKGMRFLFLIPFIYGILVFTYRTGREGPPFIKQLNEELTPAGQERLDRFDCSRTEPMNRQDELIYSQTLMGGILCAHMREDIGWP